MRGRGRRRRSSLHQSVPQRQHQGRQGKVLPPGFQEPESEDSARCEAAKEAGGKGDREAQPLDMSDCATTRRRAWMKTMTCH